jgi:hypothetical protein
MADAVAVSGPRDRRWLVLGVIALAQLMVVVDLTVMKIALPLDHRHLRRRRSCRRAHAPLRAAGPAAQTLTG